MTTKTKAPWAKNFRPGRIRGPKTAPIHILAERYFARAIARDQTVFHVFPVAPSGRGTSADFRRCLAALITGQDPHGSGYYGPGPHTLNATRERLERQAAAMGYHFIEVDPADWEPGTEPDPAGIPEPTFHTFSLYWNSESGQTDIHMGTFDTEAEALAAIPAAKAEMEAQNNGPTYWIDAGSWEVLSNLFTLEPKS